jgi:hypothetical protein
MSWSGGNSTTTQRSIKPEPLTVQEAKDAFHGAYTEFKEKSFNCFLCLP